jgi:hypothetical protein
MNGISKQINNSLENIDKVSSKWILIFITIVAALFLIPAWFHYDVISRDGAFHYIPIAGLYLKGKYLEALAMEFPVYPVLLALFSYITGFDLELSGRVLSAVFFILTAIGLFKLAYEIFKSNAVALITVFFMLTNRDLFDLGVDCLKETFFLCLIVWANYFMFCWVLTGKKYISLAVSIFLFLLGSLLRSSSMFFLLAWYFIWITRGRKWKVLVASLLIFSLVTTALLYFNDNIFYNVLRSYNPKLLMLDEGFAFHVVKYLECYFTTSNPIAIILACFGVITLYKKNIYMQLMTAVFFVAMVVFGMRDYISDRYILPMVIMFYPVSGYIAIQCVSSSKKIIIFVGIAAILYSFAQWVDLSITKPDPRMLAIKQSGQWILKNYGPDLAFTTNQDRIAFYAKGKLPDNDREKIDLTKDKDIIVIDVDRDNGDIIKQKFDKEGKKPVKIFGSIFIYIPKHQNEMSYSPGLNMKLMHIDLVSS